MIFDVKQLDHNGREPRKKGEAGSLPASGKRGEYEVVRKLRLV